MAFVQNADPHAMRGGAGESLRQSRDMRKKESLRSLRAKPGVTAKRRSGDATIPWEMLRKTQSERRGLGPSAPPPEAKKDPVGAPTKGLLGWTRPSDDEVRRNLAEDAREHEDEMRIDSTVSFVENLKGEVENVPLASAVAVGWWPGAFLEFLEINRDLYRSMMADITGPFAAAFDKPIADAVAVLRDVQNPDNHLKYFLRSGFVIQRNYWRQVVMEDNCYMYSFSDRRRSPNEDIHYNLRKALEKAVKSAILRAPLPIDIFLALNTVKNAHAVLDSFIRSQLQCLIEGEDIPEISLKEIVCGLRDDILAQKEEMEALEADSQIACEDTPYRLPPAARQEREKSDSEELSRLYGEVHSHLRITIDIYSFVVWQMLEFENTMRLKDPAQSFHGRGLEEEFENWDSPAYTRRMTLYQTYRRKIDINRQLSLIFHSMSSTESLKNTKDLIENQQRAKRFLKTFSD